MTPDLKARLWEAIQSLSSAPENERTLTGLSLMLQDETLKSALHPFTLEGPHGRLLDADHESLTLADMVCFEMEELMHAKGAALPVLTYLFHRLEARFDGKPTLLILDEAWLFLDDPMFAARIREWLKTLRKKNVSVLFATQSLADIANLPSRPRWSRAVPHGSSCRTSARRSRSPKKPMSGSAFNARQIELISRATPKRDYYYQSPLGARVFDLGLGPIALSICGASTPEDQALLDRIWAETEGDGFPECWLHEKGLPWAAELLSRWPGHAQTADAPASFPPAELVAAE